MWWELKPRNSPALRSLWELFSFFGLLSAGYCNLPFLLLHLKRGFLTWVSRMIKRWKHQLKVDSRLILSNHFPTQIQPISRRISSHQIWRGHQNRTVFGMRTFAQTKYQKLNYESERWFDNEIINYRNMDICMIEKMLELTIMAVHNLVRPWWSSLLEQFFAVLNCS